MNFELKKSADLRDEEKAEIIEKLKAEKQELENVIDTLEDTQESFRREIEQLALKLHETEIENNAKIFLDEIEIAILETIITSIFNDSVASEEIPIYSLIFGKDEAAAENIICLAEIINKIRK